jgi:hypothetical protein
MEELIRKWRRCAQKTAERVFITVKARVNRMGGLKNIASNNKRRGWDDEPRPENSQGEDVEVEEAMAEEQEVEEVEEEFTMEIMLRMLGVDETIIRWDRGLCNFIKE